MKWCLVTCDKSRHIVPAQKHLFKKYAPQAELHYIDMRDYDIKTWGPTVAELLPDDAFVVFGLDDYLPCDSIREDLFSNAMHIMSERGYDRFEIGYGASNSKGKIGFGIRTIDIPYPQFTAPVPYMEYGPETVYSVSCQFAIWKTTSLKSILRGSTTPWDFEINHFCKAACFDYPVFRWIEESALSGRHPGKINVLGLRPKDVAELIELGLIDESKIQYGMPKGPVPPFDPTKVGPKYQWAYE